MTHTPQNAARPSDKYQLLRQGLMERGYGVLGRYGAYLWAKTLGSW